MSLLSNSIKERKTLEAELGSLQAEIKDLKTLESHFWVDYNNLESEIHDLKIEQDSIENQTNYISDQVEKLKKTNVYNDAFRIWHEGVFGTINGFRLGRLPNNPVDWNEINAGFGQTILLLDVLTKKLKFEFDSFVLIPNGSFPKIQKIEGDKTITFELFVTQDTVFFWNRTYDSALSALLTCVQNIGDYCEKQDTKFRLPYRIEKDKIGDVSIRLQSNTDELWTKALKYTLINIKWILAFVCGRGE
jgi:beclin 1